MHRFHASLLPVPLALWIAIKSPNNITRLKLRMIPKITDKRHGLNFAIASNKRMGIQEAKAPYRVRKTSTKTSNT
jgi:hypothetical protein